MRLVMMILCFIPAFSLMAQDSTKYIFSTGFGYDYVRNDDFRPQNVIQDQWDEENSFNISISAYRKLSKRFSAGVGFVYNTSHKEIFKKENQRNLSSGYVGLTGNFASEQKAKTYSPQIIFRYDYPITEKISICADLYTRFDFYYSKFESEYTPSGQTLVIGGNPYGYLYDSVYGNIIFDDSTRITRLLLGEIESNNYQDTRSLRVGIRPSIKLALFKNAGIEVAFGVFEFRKKLFDSRLPEETKLSKEFRTNFGPETWMIGFYLAI